MKVHNRGSASNLQKKPSKQVLVPKRTPKRDSPVKGGVLKYESYQIDDLKQEDKQDLEQIDQQYYLREEKKR
jgi:hypothetical protein